MLYKKLFKLSNLSNHQICKILGFDHTRRKRYENAKTIEIEKFIRFSKELQIPREKVIELVTNELLKIYKETL